MMLNPCNKCIVRACCSVLCEESERHNRRMIFWFSWWDLLKDLYKSSEWVLLTVMSFLYMALAILLISLLWRGLPKLFILIIYILS